MSAIDQLRGVWNIVPTPFREDASLDEDGVRTMVEFVIGTGVDGMTVLGVMGEVGRLSDHERRRVIELTVERAAGRLPVCAGVTHAATDRAVALAREAQAKFSASRHLQNLHRDAGDFVLRQRDVLRLCA